MKTKFVSKLFLQSIVLLLAGCLLVGTPGVGWARFGEEPVPPPPDPAPEAATPAPTPVSPPQAAIVPTIASESFTAIAEPLAEMAALSPAVGQVSAPVNAEVPGTGASQQSINEDIVMGEDFVAPPEAIASSPDIVTDEPSAGIE